MFCITQTSHQLGEGASCHLSAFVCTIRHTKPLQWALDLAVLTCADIGDQVFHQMLGQLKHLPFLVLAARICPDHVEATLFATIMAISNVGGDVAHFWGAALLDWLGTHRFVSFSQPTG